MVVTTNQTLSPVSNATKAKEKTHFSAAFICFPPPHQTTQSTPVMFKKTAEKSNYIAIRLQFHTIY